MTTKLTIVFIIAAFVFAFGCGTAPAPPETIKDEGADISKIAKLTEAEVTTTLESLRATVEKNDSDAWSKISSDDFVLVTSEGNAETRAERMKVVKDGKIKVEKLEYTDPKIRIYGNTAVVVTGASGKANMDGKDKFFDDILTIVFVKGEGGVKEVSAHITNKAKPE